MPLASQTSTPHTTALARVRARVVLAVVALVLVIHVASTLLLVAPPNPVQLVYRGLANRWIHPLFDQNWRLFAPDPVTSDKHLLVACRMRRLEGDGVEETPPVNVSERLFRLREASRLSPAVGLLRAELGAMTMRFEAPDPIEARVRQHEEHASARAVITQMDDLRRVRASDADAILARIGSLECERLHAGRAVTEVRVLEVLVEPRPFSKRNDPNAKRVEHVLSTDWLPRVAVDAFGCAFGSEVAR